MADRPGPSTISIVIATAIVAALGGYFAGQAKNLGVFGSNSKRSSTPDSKEVDSDEESNSGDDQSPDEEEQDKQAPLEDFEDDGSECKLVLVVRTDLGMTKGKIAAQASHATLACYKALASSPSPGAKSLLRRWEHGGQAKVAVQVKSEDELELLQAQAMSLGICARIIHDAGRTQIAAGSATVLGVGPAPKGKVDLVTGGLKLL